MGLIRLVLKQHGVRQSDSNKVKYFFSELLKCMHVRQQFPVIRLPGNINGMREKALVYGKQKYRKEIVNEKLLRHPRTKEELEDPGILLLILLLFHFLLVHCILSCIRKSSKRKKRIYSIHTNGSLGC